MKRFLKDSALNVLSSLILVFMLQFLILPILADDYDASFFGIVLVVIAIRNIAAQLFGGTLTNFHLFKQHSEILNLDEFYNSVLYISILISVIFATVILVGFELDIISIVLLSISIGLAVFNNYQLVYFRKNLLYFKILLTQLIMFLGYTVGLLLYFSTEIWALIIVFPEILVFVYLIFTLNQRNYSFKFLVNKNDVKNKLKLIKEYLPLFISSSINNIVSYLERLIFTPILGTAAITNYHVASVTPKTISLGVTPVNGVILSYIMKSKKEISKQIFLKVCFVVFLIFISINVILYYFTPVMIGFFYPKYYEEVSSLLVLANIAITLGILANCFNPLIFKLAGTKIQMKISLYYGCCYIFLGLLLTLTNGVEGFIYSVLISNLFKFVLLIIFAMIFIKKGTRTFMKGDESQC